MALLRRCLEASRRLREPGYAVATDGERAACQGVDVLRDTDPGGPAASDRRAARDLDAAIGWTDDAASTPA